jgi:hypothetical protein
VAKKLLASVFRGLGKVSQLVPQATAARKPHDHRSESDNLVTRLAEPNRFRLNPERDVAVYI